MTLERIVLDLSGEGAGEDTISYAIRRGFVKLVVRGPKVRRARSATQFVRERDNGLSAPGGVRLLQFVVRKPSDLEECAKHLLSGDAVAVSFEGESVIPLENLIAMRKGKGTLYVVARGPGSVPGMLGALEHGSDAVIVSARTPADIDELERLVEKPALSLNWRKVEVTRIHSGGIGDRVIVDTTSMLGEREGMLVGSSGAFLLHVISEVKGSRYTRPRPFRVNAGALHSYTLLADGETRYLSELEPGDRVVVAGRGSHARSVRVGRLKIERRPLTMIEVKSWAERYTLFAQEAETVRVSGMKGPVPVTEVRAGDRLWGVSLPSARHFGKVVEETIIER